MASVPCVQGYRGLRIFGKEVTSVAFAKKRWICLIAGVVIEFLNGIAYAWSVFQTPLVDKFGWSISQISMAYTLYFLVLMLMSLFCGAKLKKMFSIRTEVLIGAILYGGGILLMGFMRGGVWELYLFFGVIASVGTAMIYPVLISYALELFPERTGFAGGLMTAGYGLGAVVWAPFSVIVMERTGNVSTAFIMMGIMFLVGIVVLSRFLQAVPAGFRNEILSKRAAAASGEQNAKAKAPKMGLYNVGKPQMIRLPVFYLAMISLLIGLACGSMIITQGSPILQLKFGMIPTVTAVIVSFLSITNTIGRLVWGGISDRIGKTRTLLMVQLFTAIFMALLFVVGEQGLFIAVLLGTTFCYGGAACLVAPTTEELFGGEHISENYSVTYSAFGLSSLIGPVVISNIRQSTGAYTMGFAVAAIMAVVGCVVTLLILSKMRAHQKAAQASGALDG